MKAEAIHFTDENGEDNVFYIEEETRVNGKNYLLVTDAPEGDASCLILKDISADTDAEATYVIVEDETELAAVLPIFAELLEDVDLLG
ncbi:MAG: DUF1292 domain-containing protein [Lachnospiraceae bacterium]